MRQISTAHQNSTGQHATYARCPEIASGARREIGVGPGGGQTTVHGLPLPRTPVCTIRELSTAHRNTGVHHARAKYCAGVHYTRAQYRTPQHLYAASQCGRVGDKGAYVSTGHRIAKA
eukprot:1821488-Rhodomonas_salina.8